MGFVSLLVLVVFSLDAAAKCDQYVVGAVWIHGLAGDEEAAFEGCKKGCFYNATFTDDGVKKCEKCSDIEDEIACTNNDATCQWKNGKCKSQSCPNIAKTKNTGAFVLNNAQSKANKGRARQLKECLEGSALEQKYNSQYWNDYRDHHNYKYYVNNYPDICVGPTSCNIGGGFPTGVAADNRDMCERISGCTYVAGGSPGSDTCLSLADRCFAVPITGTPATDQQACVAQTGCAYVSGTGTCVAGWTTFLATSNDAAANKQACEALQGVYSPDGVYPDYPRHPGNDRCYLQCRISSSAVFVAGTNTKKQCEDRGCTYTGKDEDPSVYSGGDNSGVDDAYPGDGVNLKKDGVVDLCEFGDKTGKNFSKCRDGENTSLAVNSIPNRCDDRLFGYPSQSCRTLFTTTKQKCEFDINERKNEEVFEAGVGGNLRPGTYYEKCVQDETLRTDPYIVLDTPVKNIVTTNITAANRQILYGYDTPESYCAHKVDVALAACQSDYDDDVQSCYSTGTTGADLALDYTELVRYHAGTKAARTACHQIYGCMYSKSNERCSVWSVWAFVLTLVITIVVVVAGLIVVGVLVLPRLVKSTNFLPKLEKSTLK